MSLDPRSILLYSLGTLRDAVHGVGACAFGRLIKFRGKKTRRPSTHERFILHPSALHILSSMLDSQGHLYTHHQA
jgi:hypothetical protein